MLTTFIVHVTLNRLTDVMLLIGAVICGAVAPNWLMVLLAAALWGLFYEIVGRFILHGGLVFLSINIIPAILAAWLWAIAARLLRRRFGTK